MPKSLHLRVRQLDLCSDHHELLLKHDITFVIMLAFIRFPYAQLRGEGRRRKTIVCPTGSMEACGTFPESLS
jgi:hypothetical protein